MIRVSKASDEVEKEISAWREPRMAFVAFDMPKISIEAGGEFRRYRGLVCWVCEHRPEAKSKLSYYIRKGARIIGYGNFPSADDANPARRKMYHYFDGPGNQPNGWDSLKAEIHVLTQQTAGAEVIAERDAFQAKYEALKREMLEREGVVNDKNSTNSGSGASDERADASASGGRKNKKEA